MEPDKDSHAGQNSRLGGFLHRRKPRKFNLRMTPMIDVIFLLLIFFVLTAKFRIPEQFLGSVLPKDESADGRAGVIEPLVLYISSTEDGCVVKIGGAASVMIHSQARDEGVADFANKLAEILRLQQRTADDPVEVEYRDDVEWDYVVKIQNVLYGMGIDDIAFNIPDED